MDYERPYYEDLNYPPLLYYVIFGVTGEDMSVSRERHHVDAIPEGLDCISYNREEHDEYMSSMLDGVLGEMLDEGNHDLYETVKNTDKWVVLRGEMKQDADLNYMRNVIGMIQATLESGALGVLDLQTFSLFSPQEWTDKIFSQEFDPYKHVVILASVAEDDSLWLHTRGMRKFGRPDISMEHVDQKQIEDAAQVIDQLIYYGVLGAFFSRHTKVHTHNGLSCVVKPQFVDDFDNPDFNNSYFRILWEECELER